MWDVMVLIPDHCLSIYFLQQVSKYAYDSFEDKANTEKNICKSVFCSCSNKASGSLTCLKPNVKIVTRD